MCGAVRCVCGWGCEVCVWVGGLRGVWVCGWDCEVCGGCGVVRCVGVWDCEVCGCVVWVGLCGVGGL